LFVTVTCWGRVVAGASAALVKGDPVVVVGHIYTSEYDDRDGNRRSSVEVRAMAVGPDLARCKAQIDRARQPADAQVTTFNDDAAVAADDDDADPSSEALPLTA
jgi:single-strand DNA-binding protein